MVLLVTSRKAVAGNMLSGYVGDMDGILTVQDLASRNNACLNKSLPGDDILRDVMHPGVIQLR